MLKKYIYYFKKIRKILTNKPITRIHKTAIIQNKNIIMEDSSEIWEHVIIRKSENKITIGENSQIGPFCVIFGGSDILIEKNVMIAPHCVISAGNHDYRQFAIPMRFAKSISDGKIVIEEDVWIGANCTITDNLTIGKGSVIGANSVVTKDIPPYSIAAGVPAKIINSRMKYARKN